MEKNIDKQLELIKRGTIEIIQADELKKKIEEAIKANKPLIIKAGFDPTAPDIHLGHTVLLRKMRHFQDLGHKVVFLIGDHTAMIGDPSGVSKTRPRLTNQEVEDNAKTYERQISKVLDTKKLKIRFNSEWLGKMDIAAVAELMSRYSVTRLLERDDFFNRYRQQKPISMLEFLYPLLQGYDSVALKADVELGGTDQKFNLLVGRDIQGLYGQSPQVVITMPLLEGTDGINKMSKSLGNYVGINEPAKDMFGKLMSISDELMYKYYELLTDEDVAKIKNMHPMEAKKNLSATIVRQYHGETEAKEAKDRFEQTFQKQDPFTGLATIKLHTSSNSGFALSSVLCKAKDIRLYSEQVSLKEKTKYFDTERVTFSWALKSKSEFRRLIKQGAIIINGEKITDPDYTLEDNKLYNIKFGKTRFVKIIVTRNNFCQENFMGDALKPFG
ncbi:MAG: hypothetical protein A3G36_03895 [Omnitrophica bacterium RIFCSPLOWO2_12_FULL_45_13]|nr:MAG: hypothetical protein A3G36_03895 [Omnitrophica bacterium RIFCSPLOWO2_12_FULL_45_13]